MTPVIRFENITKRFNAFTANDAVTFSIAKGTIHGVVGENGAGKSTIMKILYGLYAPDEGQIFVDEKAVSLKNPLDATRLGIGMVHQHFMLVPTLPVWKNVCLGVEPGGFLRESKILAELNELQKSFGLSLDLSAPIETLSVGEQQQVEILKLLYRRADILILDEPTAVLTPQEVDALFLRLLELNRQGKTIILITHKLHEILRFTKNVTVMRQAKVITTEATATLDEAKLAELIIGRKGKTLENPHGTAPTSRPVLSLKEVSLYRKGESRARLNKISFDVRRNEIVGIAGISGNGQQELIEVITQVESRFEGDISLFERPLRSHHPYQVKQEGFGLIPADRNDDGLIGRYPIYDNLTLGHQREDKFTRGAWRSESKIRKHAEPLLDKFDIRPRNLDAKARRLSGGNQQKVIIAREVTDDLKFLLATYPTRGVDIGAIEFIYDLILKKRQAGAAVLLISSELDELFALSDRILVFFEGRIVGEVDPTKTTPKEIGLMMTGCKAV